MLAQTGELLCCQASVTCSPRWRSRTPEKQQGRTDRTFKIRQGVVPRHGGACADDVVYTYTMHTKPKGGRTRVCLRRGLSVRSEEGRGLHGGVHLAAPNGNFPSLPPRQLQHMIILPRGTDPASGESTFIGTGPSCAAVHGPKSGHVHPQRAVRRARRRLPSQTSSHSRHQNRRSGADRRDARCGSGSSQCPARRTVNRPATNHQAEVQRTPRDVER